MQTTWTRGAKSPYQYRDITHFPDWGALIVADAFFNNLAAGTLLVGGIAWVFGDVLMAAMMPFMMTAALALLLVDLGLLVADLGAPLRFTHSLRVMRLTSPLSVGVWALSCFGIFLGIACVCAWILAILGSDPSIGAYALSASLRLCAVMACMAAVFVICYKGVVFSCSSQPGVCQARWLTPFMVADSLLMGLAVFAILAICFAPSEAVLIRLILPTIALLIARSICFGLLWQDLKKRAREINSSARNRWIGIIVYGIGGILPLILLFLGAAGMAVAALLFLLAGYCARRWIITLTRPFPPYSRELHGFTKRG